MVKHFKTKLAGKGKGKGGCSEENSASSSEKSGLQFPVGRISSHLRQGKFATRVTKGTHVFLESVIGCPCVEILQLVGNIELKNKKSLMIPTRVTLAAKNDEQLNELLGSATIAAGVVLQNIYE